MTVQKSDTIVYRGQSYNLLASTGGQLFRPDRYGLKPEMVSEANLTGYTCTYIIPRTRLYLESVTVGVGPGDRLAVGRGEGVALFGVAPALAPGGYYAWYDGLHQLIPYSGVLTLAADFITELYADAGFNPPWKFRAVIDLMLRAGSVVQVTDRSAEMARMRAALADRGPQASGSPDDDR